MNFSTPFHPWTINKGSNGWQPWSSTGSDLTSSFLMKIAIMSHVTDTTWVLQKCLCHKSLFSVINLSSAGIHLNICQHARNGPEETICTSAVCHTHNGLVNPEAYSQSIQTSFWISWHGETPSCMPPTIVVSLCVVTVKLRLLDNDCLPFTVWAAEHQLKSNLLTKKGLQSWVHKKYALNFPSLWSTSK